MLALSLLTHIVLNATYQESLPLFIRTTDIAQFESSFNEFLNDASISTQEKHDTLTLLTQTVAESRALLEQEAALSTDKTKIAQGTAQLVAGTVAGAHGSLAIVVALATACGLQSMVHKALCIAPKFDTMSHRAFPYSYGYNFIMHGLETGSLKQLISAALFDAIYVGVITPALLYASYKLYAAAYKNLTYKQYIEQRLMALDAIEKLILATSPQDQGELDADTI